MRKPLKLHFFWYVFRPLLISMTFIVQFFYQSLFAEPKTDLYSDLPFHKMVKGEFEENTLVRIKGFYFIDADKKPFLAQIPKIKSCCIKTNSELKKLFLIGDFPVLQNGTLTTVKGKIFTLNKKDQFLLESIKK